MFLELRWVIYGLIIYNTYYINGWIAFAFFITFFGLELIIYVATNEFKKVKEATTILANKLDSLNQASSTNGGFHFATKPLSEEEVEWVRRIKEYKDEESVNNLLNARCLSSTVDFADSGIALPIKLSMVDQLLNIIQNSQPPDDWDETLDEQ
jgi:hypothetical protein